MPNYPDILGRITGGARLSLDVADVAFGLRPGEVTAGRPFEALLIVQNGADCEIDAQVKLNVPDKDAKNTRGRFTSKADKRIAVGLLPAEVGYVSLPVLADVQTAPGSYTLQIEVEIKRIERKPNRVRSAPATPDMPLRAGELTPEAAAQVAEFGALRFSAATAGRPSKTGATLTLPFTLAPAGISTLGEPGKAGWHSLWTIHETLGDDSLAEQARALTAMVLPQIKRQNVFFPLLLATQMRAERAGYRLWAGEAVLISKLLTLVLETGLPVATAAEEAAPYPHWFTALCKLLLQKPDLASNLELLVSDLLYGDLIYDAAMSGFSMVGSATSEDLGNPTEMGEYAESLVKTFSAEGGEPLDFIHSYLPLVLGGLLAHSRVMMSGETALDTLELLVNARNARQAEQDAGNQFVFELTDSLLDRTLKLHDTSEQRYLDPIERLRHGGPGQRD